MQPHRRITAAIAVGVSALTIFAVAPSSASFHLMQIEQALGGVAGDTSAQAIQLRLRAPGETALGFTRLRAWDAAGANPITLINFSSGVANGSLGASVLIATPGFANYTDTPIAADYLMTQAIPDSYLSAGSLTFEGDLGTVYWRLSFGGAGYTGSTLGNLTNDTDGDFGTPFAGPLPSQDLQALLFQGLATDSSTTNAADFFLTVDPATFTNNAGNTATLVPEPTSIAMFLAGAFLVGRTTRRQGGRTRA